MDLPRLEAHLETAISDQSVASLSAPFANLPQESSDVSASGDVAEILNHANVGISTSLTDLKVAAYANVGASISQFWMWLPTLMSGLPY